MQKSKMSCLVKLLFYASAGDNAYRSNPLRLKINFTIWLYLNSIFQKWSFYRKGKALLFVTFSEDMKIFFFNFSYFRHFWGLIDISSSQKKLLTSAYNRWYQQRFSFSFLEIGCLIIIFVSVLHDFFLKIGEAGHREWITWNCCSLISLKQVTFLTDCSYEKSNN